MNIYCQISNEYKIFFDFPVNFFSDKKIEKRMKNLVLNFQILGFNKKFLLILNPKKLRFLRIFRNSF